MNAVNNQDVCPSSRNCLTTSQGVPVLFPCPRRAGAVATALSLLLTLCATRARAQDAPPAPPESAPPPAPSADAPPPPPLPPPPAPDPRIDEIDQRSRILERKLELIDEQSAARKAAEAVVGASDRGFNYKSADNLFSIRFKALFQADGREYLDDDALALRTTFLIRKARPILEATFWDRIDLRLMPDFGGGTTVLQDAYADLRLASWLAIRAGKWKAALALERYQGDAALVFPERGAPTFLSSNREVGFALVGAPLGGAISYEAGIFNGGLDNATDDLDTNQAKDFIGRLFFQPWKSDPYSPLTNLGVGFGASTGIQRGTPTVGTTAAVPQLPAYRTLGQQTFFSYGSDVFARGRRTRLSPQGYWYVGPVGVLAEWIQTEQKVQKGSTTATLEQRAWQVQGVFVAGGKALFEGATATAPFDPARGTWGALEIGVRYNDLDIDDAAFPTFADPKRSASDARSFGVTLNWVWNRNVKLPFAYEHSWFKQGASAGDRRPENVLIQRVQVNF
jgi:phosphate-selective porin OprO/OprP